LREIAQKSLEKHPFFLKFQACDLPTYPTTHKYTLAREFTYLTPRPGAALAYIS